MTLRMRLQKTIGEIIGRATWRKVRHAPAPSALAASYSLVGTACSPARKTSVMLPMPQTLIRITLVGLESMDKGASRKG
jgi:hypothetical protein